MNAKNARRMAITFNEHVHTIRITAENIQEFRHLLTEFSDKLVANGDYKLEEDMTKAKAQLDLSTAESRVKRLREENGLVPVTVSDLERKLADSEAQNKAMRDAFQTQVSQAVAVALQQQQQQHQQQQQQQHQ